MPSEDRQNISMLWYIAAVFIGGALPLMAVGRAVTSVWLVLGIILGALAMGKEMLNRTAWRQCVRCPMGVASAALFITFGLSAAFSIKPLHSWQQWEQLLLIMILSVLLLRVLMAMPTRAVRLTLNVLASLTTLMALYILGDAVWHPNHGAFVPNGLARNPQDRFNYLSSVLAVLSPFVWVWLLRLWRDKKISCTLGYVVAALVFIALVVANGRAGWLGAGASMVVFAFLSWRYHGFRITWKTATALAALAVVALASYGASRGFDYMWHRLDFSHFSTAGSGRLPIWTFAASHMLDNPFTGIGIHTFRFLPPPDYHLNSQLHPHNFIVQLLLEVGLLGGLASALFIYRLFRNLWKYVEVSIYSAAGLASLTAFFTCALANTSIYQARWLVFLVVAYTLSIRLCRAPKNNE